MKNRILITENHIIKKQTAFCAPLDAIRGDAVPFCFFLILLFFLNGFAWAGEPKWFVAPVLDKAPNLELGLEDPAWGQALEISITKLENAPGDTIKYPTESYWLRANGSLFVGFKCFNPISPNLWGTPNQTRDQSIYNNESVELFVGNFSGDLYYQLIVDAFGNIFDGKCGNPEWNGDWKCKVDRKGGFWTAVIEIPEPILSTVWNSGSFVTIDATRHAFQADGSGAEKIALALAGNQAPEEKLFLGNITLASLAEKVSQSVNTFKRDSSNVPVSKAVADRLAAIEGFASDCNKPGDVTLERYREMYGRYIQSKRELAELKQEIIMNVIFGDEGGRS